MASSDHPDTAPRPKPTGKKAERLSQKEQSERFKQTARAVEAQDADAFEKAFQAVAKAKGPS